MLTGPTLSPIGQFVTRVVTPRVHVEPRYSPGPAKRFAQGIGAAFSVPAAVLALAFGLHTVAWILIAVVGLFAVLEAAAGFCMGCVAFRGLMRTGVVPQSVCVECADIWARG